MYTIAKDTMHIIQIFFWIKTVQGIMYTNAKERNQMFNERQLTIKMLRMVKNEIIMIIIGKKSKWLTRQVGTPAWQSSHPVKTSPQEERRKQENLKPHRCHRLLIINHLILWGNAVTVMKRTNMKFQRHHKTSLSAISRFDQDEIKGWSRASSKSFKYSLSCNAMQWIKSYT